MRARIFGQGSVRGCDEFHFGPNFRGSERCSSLPDRDFEVVLEYFEHGPNIVGSVVKVK